MSREDEDVEVCALVQALRQGVESYGGKRGDILRILVRALSVFVLEIQDEEMETK